MGSIKKSVDDAGAKELFELAYHLGTQLQVARADGDGYIRLSVGDIAEFLLDWAEEPCADAKPSEQTDTTSDIRAGAATDIQPKQGTD